jgi:hypothetical protein
MQLLPRSDDGIAALPLMRQLRLWYARRLAAQSENHEIDPEIA